MTLGTILFTILAATVFISNGTQAYIHFEAYPLIGYVGKPEFATYLSEYEKRLTVPLLVPYGLTVLSNIVLIFVHPLGLSVGLIIISLLLNLAVAAITMMMATPVYNELKQAGQGTPEIMARLMQINLYRLVISTVASVVVIIMMLSLIPG